VVQFRAPQDPITPKVRRIMRLRLVATLCRFALAAVVALKISDGRIGNLYLLPDPLSAA
jgi:hypothetical protein